MKNLGLWGFSFIHFLNISNYILIISTFIIYVSIAGEKETNRILKNK